METEIRRPSLFRFGLFEADATRNTLRRNGSPLKIQDQPFRVLIHLLEHAGEVVARDELRQLLWSHDTFVDFDASLNVILKKLRAILRDDSDNPRFIETVPRRGYRFIAPVELPDSDSVQLQSTLKVSMLKEKRGSPPIGANNVSDLRPRTWSRAIQSVVLAALVISATLLVMNWKRAPIASAPMLRSNILPPQHTSFVSTSLALSGDGQMLAFVANDSNGNPALLWVQALDSGSARPLTGTEGATLPFWSPDGKHIGFFARSKLWTIDREGGPPQALCDAPLGRGGTWNQDGVILFAPDPSGPLQEISAVGGVVREVLPHDAQSDTVHAWWPQFLPDGKHFIYWSHSKEASQVDGIYLAQLGSDKHRLLVPTESNGLYANGRLLYLHDQALLSRRFDVNVLKLDATSAPLAEGVGVHGGMHLADFTTSQNGLLAYFSGPANQGWPMVMYNRSGKPEGRVYSERNFYLDPRFSPDGKRLAVSIARPDSMLGDLWVIDIQAGTRTRLTFESRNATHPVWSADEKTIYYSAANGPDRVPHIYARLVNGSGNERAVLETPGISEMPFDISKDGRYLAYARRENGEHWEIWILPLLRSGKPFALLRLPSCNFTDPAFSPDGTQVAYSSDESGHSEVYISRSAGGGRWQVSAGGGADPAWAPDGRRLYYMDSAENIMYVDVHTNGTAVWMNKPAEFSSRASFAMPRPIAVAPDGSLLVDGHNDEPASPLTMALVTNWPPELRR